MAIHDIQQPATSGKYAGCVYVTNMGRVFIPHLGFFDQTGFDVVMGASGNWHAFVGQGPAWAHCAEATTAHPIGVIFERNGAFVLNIDTTLGWPSV